MCYCCLLLLPSFSLHPLQGPRNPIPPSAAFAAAAAATAPFPVRPSAAQALAVNSLVSDALDSTPTAGRTALAARPGRDSESRLCVAASPVELRAMTAACMTRDRRLAARRSRLQAAAAVTSFVPAMQAPAPASAYASAAFAHPSTSGSFAYTLLINHVPIARAPVPPVLSLQAVGGAGEGRHGRAP